MQVSKLRRGHDFCFSCPSDECKAPRISRSTVTVYHIIRHVMHSDMPLLFNYLLLEVVDKECTWGTSWYMYFTNLLRYLYEGITYTCHSRSKNNRWYPLQEPNASWCCNAHSWKPSRNKEENPSYGGPKAPLLQSHTSSLTAEQSSRNSSLQNVKTAGWVADRIILYTTFVCILVKSYHQVF